MVPSCGGVGRPKRACRRERCRRRSRVSRAGMARGSWSDVPAVEIWAMEEEKKSMGGGRGEGWSLEELPAERKVEDAQTRNAIA